jgi:hypothetical protein
MTRSTAIEKVASFTAITQSLAGKPGIGAQ